MNQAVEFVDIDWCGRPIQLEYQWVGVRDAQAPVMLFLHEGLGSVSMWRNFPHELCIAVGCTGLVYSRPGYGNSSPRLPDENWAPDFMHRQALEVLPAFLTAVGVDVQKHPPWLYGHSDGGSIALLYAAHHPHQVTGAIVVAPHIFVEEISVSSITQARQAYLETDLRQRLARHHADVDSAFYGWNNIWLKPEFRQWNITQDLPAITCPMLAVQGEDDQYGTLEQVRGIARAVPQCQLLEIPACGHSPHKDAKDSLIAGVQRFYQIIGGSR